MTEFAFTNAADLEKSFSEIENLLFDTSNIYTIKYEGNDTELNFTENNKIFIDAITGDPVIYCIWLKPVSDNFVKVYIGHVGEEPQKRMKNHLSKKIKEQVLV